jgi:ribosomal protein L37E
VTKKEHKTYEITCKQCGSTYNAYKPHPIECGMCRSKVWDKDIQVKENYVPIPKVDHSIPLPLKAGMHCPYETVNKSHTVLINSDLSEIGYYCASCDACWSRNNEYLGVVAGIGAKR